MIWQVDPNCKLVNVYTCFSLEPHSPLFFSPSNFLPAHPAPPSMQKTCISRVPLSSAHEMPIYELIRSNLSADFISRRTGPVSLSTETFRTRSPWPCAAAASNSLSALAHHGRRGQQEPGSWQPAACIPAWQVDTQRDQGKTRLSTHRSPINLKKRYANM